MKEARQRPTVDEQSDFVRAAVNRYYYSVFLRCRKRISIYGRKWGKQTHSKIFEYFRKDIPRIIEDRVTSLMDEQLIEEYLAREIVEQAKFDGLYISEKLHDFHALRNVADYSNKPCISFQEPEGYFVEITPLVDLREWQADIDARITQLLKVLDDVS